MVVVVVMDILVMALLGAGGFFSWRGVFRVECLLIWSAGARGRFQRSAPKPGRGHGIKGVL